VSSYVSFTEKCQRLRISRTVELVDLTKIVLGEEKSKLLFFFLTGLNLIPKINAGTDLCSPLHCNVRSLIFNVTMQVSNTKLKKVLHWLASISFSDLHHIF
jgi:hypothetical protein